MVVLILSVIRLAFLLQFIGTVLLSIRFVPLFGWGKGVEQGVKQLEAKASTPLHGKVLAKIGVNKVVFPESDIAVKLAHSMTSTSIIDYIELSDDFNIAELGVPAFITGQTLLKADLRAKFGLNVLAIISGQKTNLSPQASDILHEGDKIVVIGNKNSISTFDAM